jgi:hypothetical protein
VFVNRANDGAWWAWQTRWLKKSQQIMSQRESGFGQQKISAAHGALRDMGRPLFLFSFLLTGIFLLVQKDSWSEFIWLLLRPAGIAFVLLYLSRSQKFMQLCQKVAGRIGILRPVQTRFQSVRDYWSKQQRP